MMPVSNEIAQQQYSGEETIKILKFISSRNIESVNRHFQAVLLLAPPLQRQLVFHKQFI